MKMSSFLESKVLILLYFAVTMSSSMEMKRVIVPEFETVDNRVKLRCQYSLGMDRLYSVKWYKDGSEFYRYVPKDTPPIQVFGVNGIQVDQKLSDDRVVTLKALKLTSSGTYTCEASSEAPRFKTVSGQGVMRILDLPDSAPLISGINPLGYKVGSFLNVTCSSPGSKPPTRLKWYINNERVNPLYLFERSPIIDEQTGLFTSYLGLRFQLKRQHFTHGRVTLKCTAKLYKHYFESSSKHAIGIGLGEKALESRANECYLRIIPTLFDFVQSIHGDDESNIFTKKKWLSLTRINFY